MPFAGLFSDVPREGPGALSLPGALHLQLLLSGIVPGLCQEPARLEGTNRLASHWD